MINPRFYEECAKRGRDPIALLQRYLDELAKKPPAWREWLLTQLALGRTVGKELPAGEEPYFPCRWCQDRDVWGDDWGGWLHWFICDWPGYGCISLPEPMAA